jgi:hypothetical protein
VLRTATVAEKGNVACIDSVDGACVPASAIATLTPIGYFEESLTGDGTKKVKIKLFSEILVQFLPNASSGTAVVAADMLKSCYLNADSSVTTTTTGRSVAGKVWGVVTGNGAGVFVQMAT